MLLFATGSAAAAEYTLMPSPQTITFGNFSAANRPALRINSGDIVNLEAATQIEPNFSLVYYNLALVYHRLNNVSAAKQSLNQYKDLEPGDEEIELVDQLLKAMDTGRPD